MSAKWTRVIPLAGLCLAGCEKSAEAPEQGANAASASGALSTLTPGAIDEIQGLDTKAMEECDLGKPDPKQVHGVVSIVLDKFLVLSDRKVFFRNRDTENDDDNSGDENKPSKGKKNPFHIYIKGIYPSGPPETGFLRVKVAMQRNSPWNFYNEGKSESGSGKIHGIGISSLLPDDTASTDLKVEKVICSNSIITVTNGSNNKKVAIFYIDLAKYKGYWLEPKAAIPFNIIVWRDDQEETPIIIDPKIRNDGSS